MDEPILGSEVIRFRLRDADSPLILDFQPPPGNAADSSNSRPAPARSPGRVASDRRIRSLTVGGRPADFDLVNGHIVVDTAALQQGENEVAIEFVAGEGTLNRNPDYLYTLFVPGRASEAFPSFDQPDLKARWTLTLEVPSSWRAVANGAEVERVEDAAGRPGSEGPDPPDMDQRGAHRRDMRQRDVDPPDVGRVHHLMPGGRTVIRFAPTEPISTYLFSFAAGRFQVETAVRDGRRLRMFHRETDSAKVARNRAAIFDLHARALAWLEEYTGIPYPFGKFDFVLIPSFQYGGMEHPGAILYRASGLLLDESATQNQLLGRASVIAHETAHMWFGDLVTMEWFDDVWTKEVFANFMAAKIVHPSFPQIDHDLRFLLAHHPAAYAVDRTAGAHPIGQQLDNLNRAGALYGAIIYQKAPIVMRKLERIVGEDAFREGLREYLDTFAFSNATWGDLIRILDQRTPRDLGAWSRVWVDEAGRPIVEATLTLDDADRIAALTLTQSDAPDALRLARGATRGARRAMRNGLLWPQGLHVRLGYGDSARVIPATLEGRSVDVAAAVGLPAPDYVLPNAGGLEYGLFRLDPRSRAWLLAHIAEIREPVARGAAWLDLWEAVLEGQLAPAVYLDAAVRSLPSEGTELLVQQILGYAARVYWRLLTPEVRRQRAPALEELLWSRLQQATTPTLESAYFNAFRNIALSTDALQRLERIWAGQLEVPGLILSESDFSDLAQKLALHEVAGADTILVAQLERIENPDRRARFAFVMPALSDDPAVRDSFFAALSDPANRTHEPWVLEGVGFLHQPLRAESSVKYIRPSLGLLEEVRRTGDIFFPGGWLGATLDGHTSPVAAEIVREFLAARPDYPADLRSKILQAADGLFRAAAIVGDAGPPPPPR